MSTETSRRIEIEVAYATSEEQHLVALEMPVGSTVASVVETCAARNLLPAAVLEQPDVGVFGRPVSLDYVLASGDRVEFYRPLRVDPKEARRLRALSK